MLEEERDALLLASLCDLSDAVDEPCPRVLIRRLEGVVVALDAGPEDHLRAHGRREVRGAEPLCERHVAHGVVR